MDRIDAAEVLGLLSALRRVGAETEIVEAKSGRGGFPRSVRETLVAFANTHGGTVLIGVDELDGYSVVPIEDIVGYRDTLVGIARDAITPPLALSTELVAVEGAVLLAAHVPRLLPDQRPAYVTSRGITGGTYLRTGDGDHQVGQGELALIIANRTQPTYDREPVPGTTVDDLDRPALLRTLQRVRDSSGRLRDLDESAVLHHVGIITEPRVGSTLTLAGLLAFGKFPQQWFPQLMVSVVAHPADTAGTIRFLDNETVRGPIPDLIVQTEAVVRRNLTVRAEMGELGRRDVPEIPTAMVREALVNALLHRDYSPTTRGTQVAVNLYPDRLEVRSPGGIFGLSEDDLGQLGASSSRNMALASLLADAYLPHSDELVAENRASGIPAMYREARSAGLALPRFRSTATGFTVTIEREPLLGAESRAWIQALGAEPGPEREVALAMLRRGPITESMLRRWGIERTAARRLLRDLVDGGIAVDTRDSREPRYVLDPARPAGVVAHSEVPAEGGRRAGRSSPAANKTVLTAVRARREFTARDIVVLTGLSRPTVIKVLNALIDAGQLEAVGAANSPRRRYHWVGGVEEDQS